MFQVSNGMIWMGDESSLQAYVAAAEKAERLISAGLLKPEARSDDSNGRDSRIMTTVAGTAIIKIHGSLTTSASWLDSYLGTTSYEEIRHALYMAASDPEVMRIVLDIHSGGGAVDGVDSLGKLIGKINNMKTVVAVATGTMGSAAYWLGASTSKVFAAPTSLVGSIGVMMVHVDRTKQLADQGVVVTAFRSGEYKALGQAFEPMTEKVSADIQKKVVSLDKIFVQHVATARKKTTEYIRAVPGEGRVFVGSEAVEVGLVDEIATVDAVLGRAVSGQFDNTANRSDNVLQFAADMGQISMTDEQRQAAALAAAAAGITAEATPATTEADAAATAASDAEAAATAAAAAAAATGDGAGYADKKTEGTADAPAPATADAMALMLGQVTEKTAALAQSQAEVASLKAQMEAMGTSVAGLSAIVAKSLANMQIGMGMSSAAADFANMDVTALLAEHNRVSTAFVAKFKAGGVAATAAVPSKAATAAMTSRDSAALAATKLA